MKRIIVFAIALGTFSFAANANALISDNIAVEVTMNEEGRTEMTFDELPDAVKTAFQESEYSAWEVQSVYKVTPDEGETTEPAEPAEPAEEGTSSEVSYEITVTDGTTPTTLIFDEEGNIVE
jgi:hypothetical protein